MHVPTQDSGVLSSSSEAENIDEEICTLVDFFFDRSTAHKEINVENGQEVAEVPSVSNSSRSQMDDTRCKIFSNFLLNLFFKITF